MKTVYTVIKLLVLVFFLILALNNTQSVPFAYLPAQHIELPLIVLLFIAFFIGQIFGVLAMFGRLLRLRSENSRLRSEVQKSARLAAEDIAAPQAADTQK